MFGLALLLFPYMLLGLGEWVSFVVKLLNELIDSVLLRER